MKILVIHGPNLNLLGRREPEIYGKTTLAEINAQITQHAAARGAAVETFQSNHEGAIVDRIQAAAYTDQPVFDGIVINPAAYTHYSIAIRDALAATGLPIIEVHLTDIQAREPFRQTSVTAPVCRAQISGRGPRGYLLAIDAILDAD